MRVFLVVFIVIQTVFSVSCEDRSGNSELDGQKLQILKASAGDKDLMVSETTEEIPVDEPIILTFNNSLDSSTIRENINLEIQDSVTANINYNLEENQKKVILHPEEKFKYSTNYSLSIDKGLKSDEGIVFEGADYEFITVEGELDLASIKINNKDLSDEEISRDIDFQVQIDAVFTDKVNGADFEQYIHLRNSSDEAIPLAFELSENDSVLHITNNEPLDYYSKYDFEISEDLNINDQFSFNGFQANFFTRLDSTYKFPQISDEELLTKIQEQTFKYFWDFGHPESGMARERNSSGDIVTTGGSGFGIMAVIVGIERGFITRQEGVDRWEKILDFLENKAERFHGAYSHWIDGNTGEAVEFSEKDDGGDLVETAFLIEGLLTVREYLNSSDEQENDLIDQINRIWESVEWDWYTQGEDVLYWHWSPNHDFEMDHKIIGYNETLITYILAASSPTYSISSEVYHSGFADNGEMVNGQEFYEYTLPLGFDYGGPLFFEHYSFLGLDPRNLEDQYANYWEQAVNHTLINRAHCIDNPNGYVGYDNESWGLTASDNHEGYSAHSPTNDLGVITPTAAVSSIPYTPEYSMDAIHRFYYLLGARLWGEYGFYDAFNPTEEWYADSYLAIDQGPIILMIENYRIGLLWENCMDAPEIQQGLDKLGFTY